MAIFDKQFAKDRYLLQRAVRHAVKQRGDTQIIDEHELETAVDAACSKEFDEGAFPDAYSLLEGAIFDAVSDVADQAAELMKEGNWSPDDAGWEDGRRANQ